MFPAADDISLLSLLWASTEMSQITVCLPDALVATLDSAASTLNRTRAELVRQAVERHLEDFDDLAVAIERMGDPTDTVLDWNQVKRELLGRV